MKRLVELGIFGCFLAHKIVRFCETKKVEFRP